jgi:hypothetical protein
MGALPGEPRISVLQLKKRKVCSLVGLILPVLRALSQSLTLKKIGVRLLKELTHPQPLASHRQILSGYLFGMRQHSLKLLTVHHVRVP